MITYKQAKQIAQNYIDSMSNSVELELLISDEYTIEKPYGWVFFYNSAKYLRTSDFHYALAGNAPFVVFKSDGSMRILGTAYSAQKYLEDLERELDLSATRKIRSVT